MHHPCPACGPGASRARCCAGRHRSRQSAQPSQPSRGDFGDRHEVPLGSGGTGSRGLRRWLAVAVAVRRGRRHPHGAVRTQTPTYAAWSTVHRWPPVRGVVARADPGKCLGAEVIAASPTAPESTSDTRCAVADHGLQACSGGARAAARQPVAQARHRRARSAGQRPGGRFRGAPTVRARPEPGTVPGTVRGTAAHRLREATDRGRRPRAPPVGQCLRHDEAVRLDPRRARRAGPPRHTPGRGCLGAQGAGEDHSVGDSRLPGTVSRRRATCSGCEVGARRRRRAATGGRAGSPGPRSARPGPCAGSPPPRRRSRPPVLAAGGRPGATSTPGRGDVHPLRRAARRREAAPARRTAGAWSATTAVAAPVRVRRSRVVQVRGPRRSRQAGLVPGRRAAGAPAPPPVADAQAGTRRPGAAQARPARRSGPERHPVTASSIPARSARLGVGRLRPATRPPPTPVTDQPVAARPVQTRRS